MTGAPLQMARMPSFRETRTIAGRGRAALSRDGASTARAAGRFTGPARHPRGQTCAVGGVLRRRISRARVAGAGRVTVVRQPRVGSCRPGMSWSTSTTNSPGQIRNSNSYSWPVVASYGGIAIR